ncbi:MAG: DUF445 family protein [Gemmatimonadota bacterium]|nr:DUF445 family protein [Gemmatimonadota bacterium]
MDDLIRPLVTITFGALAGGLTNTVAIWMLFHPYEAPRIGRWRLRGIQGAIPKNQPRLAAAIGRTVGSRLLTDEDLTQTFTNSEFRVAFDERLADFLDELLHKERGSLRDILPAGVVAQVESLLAEVTDGGLQRLRTYIASPRFDEAVRHRAGSIVEAVSGESIGGILTPARGEALEATVQNWFEDAVESDGFRTAVDDYLDRAAHRLLAPSRTFEEILPLGLVGSLEKAIQGYLPLAIARLGRLLEDPAARARFEHTIHELLRRFLSDLKFHQRVVARLVMTEETVNKVLDTIETEGAERLSEILQDPAVQAAMARGVNEAIVDFLRRPVSSVLGDPTDESVVSTRTTLVEWMVGMARDPATREFLIEKMHAGLAKAGARTWGDIFAQVPPERVAEWLVAAARSEAADRFYAEAAGRMSGMVLDRPIGTPSGWLPPEAPVRIETALGDPIWAWLQTQVPYVVERMDVARRVEEKVLHFPTAKMEELIRRVTDRELKLIVRLGYVLGAVIGAGLVVLDSLLPG